MNSKLLLSIVTAVLLIGLTFGMPAQALASGSGLSGDIGDIRFDGGMVNKAYIVDGMGWITVDYTKFLVNSDTEIDIDDGALIMGAFVDVRAVKHDGKLCATRITVLGEDPGKVLFEGAAVSELSLMDYLVKVCGTKFTTTADTDIGDGLAVGSIVKVEADRIDGKLVATKIDIIGD